MTTDLLDQPAGQLEMATAMDGSPILTQTVPVGVLTELVRGDVFEWER